MAGIVFTNSGRFRYGAVVHEPNAAGLEWASNNQKSVGVPASTLLSAILKAPHASAIFFAAG